MEDYVTYSDYISLIEDYYNLLLDFKKWGYIENETMYISRRDRKRIRRQKSVVPVYRGSDNRKKQVRKMHLQYRPRTRNLDFAKHIRRRVKR